MDRESLKWQRNSRARAGDHMANAKEIQSRIKSIQDTMKITNAMYMISSSKLRGVFETNIIAIKFFLIEADIFVLKCTFSYSN